MNRFMKTSGEAPASCLAVTEKEGNCSDVFPHNSNFVSDGECGLNCTIYHH